MMKKISLPMMVTVMCVMVSVVLGLVRLNQSQQSLKSKSVSQVEEEKVVRTDYSSVARKTLDWIDQQRNDDGWYIFQNNCDLKFKTCGMILDFKDGNEDGLIATWARFNFYQQTKNQNDLAIVKSDIDKFYKKYPNGVDNSLWICKITYDMWKSDEFDEETKDKLQNICFKSTINDSFFDYEDYQEYQEELVTSFGKDKYFDDWLGYTVFMRTLDNYFGLTSDLLAQYLWTQDESKLDLAKKYFESGKKIINGMGDKVRANDDCLLGLSAIDLYEYGGKDENVLNYVKEKYLDYGGGFVNEYRTAICVLMANRLYGVTNNNTFLKGLEINKGFMVNGLLDGGDSKANKTGTYGFFATSYGGAKYLTKDVMENGLMVELLRN